MAVLIFKEFGVISMTPTTKVWGINVTRFNVKVTHDQDL